MKSKMTKITAEISHTPQELAHGLMFRKHLDIDKGMVFKFPDLQYVSFWGKNTYIPLDVAFVDKDNKISEIKSISPMSTRIISSSIPCKIAIEVNAGFFKNNGIGIGNAISISENDGVCSVEFSG